MKIHRYFFWIEDNFIEIYKNGNLEKYEGEEKLYIDNFENFWEKWKKNSKIIASRDAIDFTFLIDKKVNKDDLLKGLDNYKKEKEEDFFYVWRNYIKKNYIDFEIDFFVKNENNTYEKIKEIQRQYIHSENDIIQLFEKNDLKILDIKDFKTIVFEFNAQKKAITKTKGRYIESEFEEDLLEITIFGDNIDEDILNNLANQRVEEKKSKVEAGLLDEFFGNQCKNRK